jgi:hypothetical protein
VTVAESVQHPDLTPLPAPTMIKKLLTRRRSTKTSRILCNPGGHLRSGRPL